MNKTGHVWDAGGERCLKCGGKDWMSGPCIDEPCARDAKDLAPAQQSRGEQPSPQQPGPTKTAMIRPR